MTFLLDVNVLIALIDGSHTQHHPAHAWFSAVGQHAWATCPITENGLLHILGNARYPNTVGPPAKVLPLLDTLRRSKGYRFWADDVSLLDATRVNPHGLTHHQHITDSYLLALAQAHNGRLATFDQHVVTGAIPNGQSALHLLQ